MNLHNVICKEMYDIKIPYGNEQEGPALNLDVGGTQADCMDNK